MAFSLNHLFILPAVNPPMVKCSAGSWCWGGMCSFLAGFDVLEVPHCSNLKMESKLLDFSPFFSSLKSIVRVFPGDAVQTKSTTFVGAFTFQIAFLGKSELEAPPDTL